MKLASYAMIMYYDHAPVLSISLMISAHFMANPNVAVLLWVINPLLFQDKTENPKDIKVI